MATTSKNSAIVSPLYLSEGKIVTHKNDYINEDVAPINRKLSETIRLIKRNSFAIDQFTYSKAATDPHDFYMAKGITADLRKQGLERTDGLYYMLYPKHVEELTHKHSPSINVINSACTTSLSLNKHWQTQDPTKKLFGINAIVTYKKALQGDAAARELLGNHTVTVADLEVIGSGMDKNGISTFHGIYDYSLVNMDGNGQAKKYTSLIGVDRKSETGNFLNEIEEALKNGESLSKDQEVAYDFISRLGASTEYITNEDGIWKNTKLTNAEKAIYQTKENFVKGREKLFEIGENQIKKYGSLGGYTQLVDDLAEIYKNPSTLIGWNTNGFDIFKLKNMEKVAPGITEYAKQKGFNLRTLSDDTFDALEEVKKMPPEMQAQLRNTLYPNGVDTVNPGGTAFQAESVFKAMFGIDADAHHNALNDTLQEGQVMGFHIDENGKVSYKANPFTKAFLDNSNQSVEQVYNHQLVTVLPKNGGGLPSLWSNPHMLVSMHDGDDVYFSNGMYGKVNSEGKFIVDEQPNPYFPGAWNNRTSYSFSNSDIEYINPKEVDSKTIDYLNRIKPELRTETERLIKVTMRPNVDYEDVFCSAYSKTNQTVTMVVPESDFDKVMQDQFSIIEYGGIDEDGTFHPLKDTVEGERIRANSYSKKNSIATGAKKELDKSSKIFESSIIDKIADNANRRLLDRNYVTLEKGLALQLVAKNIDTGFGTQLGDFAAAINNLFKDPNGQGAEDFLNVVSGAKLTSEQESFVTNAIGKNWRTDINTWLTSWTKKGENGAADKHLKGWLDNSLYFMFNTNTESVMGRYLIGLGGKKHTSKERSQISMAFAHLRDYMSYTALQDETLDNPVVRQQKFLAGQGMNVLTMDYRADNGIREYPVPMFLKRHLPKNTDISSSTVRLNIYNPYSAYNSFFNAIKRDKNDFSESQLDALVKDFLYSLNNESFNHEYLYSQKKENRIKEKINKLINNEKLTAKDRFLQAIDALNLETRKIDAFKPVTTAYVPSTSTALTEAMDADTANKVLSEVKQQVDEAFGPDTSIERYLFGGSRETARKNFQEQIYSLSEPERQKSMLLLNKHMEDAEKYADKIRKAVSSHGGSMFESRGRFYVSFKGHDPIDISSFLPRLKTNAGTIYVKYGNTSWLSGLNGVITSNGLWDVRTSIGAAVDNLGNLDQALTDAEISGKRLEDALMGRISLANKSITDKDILPFESQKTDYRVSNSMTYKDAILDQRNKDNLMAFLKSKKNTSSLAGEIADKLKKFDPDKNKDIPSDIHRGIKRLVNDGILPASFTITSGGETGVFDLNADLKDTQMESRFGIRDIAYGAEAATRNYNTSAQYVDESSVSFIKSRLKNNAFEESVTTDFDEMVKKVNGIEMSNKIAVRAMDINTKIRDDFFNRYIAENIDNISVSDARNLKKLKARINPIEGGAVLAGSIIDETGYVSGVKAMDLTHKEVLNRDDIAKTKDSFSIEIDNEGKRHINYKYGDGFFVKAGDDYLTSFSSYDSKTSEAVKKASIVTQKYFNGEGKQMAMTSDEVTSFVLNTAEKLGIEINSEEDFRKIADQYLSKKLVAVPVTVNSSAKTKMGLSEKQMTEILLDPLGTDPRNSEIYNKIADNVKENTGIDIKNQVLEKSVFDDFVSGNLSSPLFDSISKEDKEELRSKLDSGLRKHFQESRYQLENLMKKVFGGDVTFLSKSIYDSEKHGFESTKFETLVDRLRKKVRSGEINKEDYKSIIGKIISGDNVRINDDLTINLDNGLNYTLDAVELHKTADKYMAKAGEIYDTYVGIQTPPVIKDKTPKLDNRTLRTLFNKVYDEENLGRIKSKMDLFNKDAFSTVFGNVLDKDGKITADSGYRQGQAIWATDAFDRNMRSNTFAPGEHLFEFIDSDDPLQQRKNRIAAKAEKATKGAVLSKEYVDELLHAEDVENALKIESESYKDKTATDGISKYDFKLQKFEDVSWDYTGNRAAYIANSKALWKNNTVVDLYNKELGLDDKFFKELDDASDSNIANDPGVNREINENSKRPINVGAGVKNPNSRYLVMPAHDSFNSSVPNPKDVGREINLTEPQSRAQRLFRRIDSLNNLKKRFDEGKINKDDYDRLSADTRDKIRQDYIDYKKSWDHYVQTNGKQGTMFAERVDKGKPLSRRTTAYVFDTNTWKYHEGAAESFDPFKDFKYSLGGKDYNLKDFHKQGHEIAFGVASVKDLEKYGFDNDYFKNLEKNFGVTKKQWLGHASIYGIDVFAHRDPNDYHLSTNSAKLYFSDLVPEGSIKVSSALAYAMKQDADGDDVVMMANYVRLKNGDLVDTSAIDILRRKGSIAPADLPIYESHRQAIDDAIELLKTHEKDMALTTFGEFNSQEFMKAYKKDYLDVEAYNNIIKEKRQALLDAPSNFIYAQSKSYLGTETAKQYMQSWNNAKQEIRSLIKSNANVLGLTSDTIRDMTDYNFIQYGNSLLRNENINITSEQAAAIKTGLSDYNRMMAPIEAHMGKTMRSATGTMDTPFTVVNRVGHLLRGGQLSDIFDNANALRMTDRDTRLLDFLQEAAKEGFLSAKNNENKMSDERVMSLAEDVGKKIDSMIRNRNKAAGDQAANELVDMLNQYGKQGVLDRNNVTAMLGEDVIKEIEAKAKAQSASNFEKIKQQMLYEESIQRAVGSMRNLFSRLSPKAAESGLYGIQRMTTDLALHEVIRGDNLQKNIKYLFDMGFNVNTEQYMRAVKEARDATEDIVRNGNMAQQMKRLKRLDISNSIRAARSSLGNQSGHGWAKNVMMLAGAVMFSGFVGGNPAAPSGSEAQSMQPQQQYMSPIPPQSDSSLNSMRNGPKQGYIININGTSSNPRINNDQIGAAISRAVTSNYNNSQVNINLKTQDRSDITYDQVYDYMEQALF